MVVVSDTGPLNYLAQIGALDILPQLFSSVIAPPFVVSELRHADAPRIVREWAEQLPSWISVRPPQNVTLFPRLGSGEREAIAVAIELQAKLVLLDDLAARDAAQSRGLATAGTLGLIAQAHTRGWLDFEESLRKLKATNYRISENIIRQVRAQLPVRKQASS
ncbi:MAG: DUF3368 domain-containing protein [Verrucomicrobia bacterium]|nr:DUF3368 domain-containing protein [Verrucomicrobiota bacterium]